MKIIHIVHNDIKFTEKKTIHSHKRAAQYSRFDLKKQKPSSIW